MSILLLIQPQEFRGGKEEFSPTVTKITHIKHFTMSAWLPSSLLLLSGVTSKVGPWFLSWAKKEFRAKNTNYKGKFI